MNGEVFIQHSSISAPQYTNKAYGRIPFWEAALAEARLPRQVTLATYISLSYLDFQLFTTNFSKIAPRFADAPKISDTSKSEHSDKMGKDVDALIRERMKQCKVVYRGPKGDTSAPTSPSLKDIEVLIAKVVDKTCDKITETCGGLPSQVKELEVQVAEANRNITALTARINQLELIAINERKLADALKTERDALWKDTKAIVSSKKDFQDLDQFLKAWKKDIPSRKDIDDIKRLLEELKDANLSQDVEDVKQSFQLWEMQMPSKDDMQELKDLLEQLRDNQLSKADLADIITIVQEDLVTFKKDMEQTTSSKDESIPLLDQMKSCFASKEDVAASLQSVKESMLVKSDISGLVEAALSTTLSKNEAAGMFATSKLNLDTAATNIISSMLSKADIETVVKDSTNSMVSKVDKLSTLSKADIVTAIQGSKFSTVTRADIDTAIQQAKLSTLSKSDVETVVKESASIMLSKTDVETVVRDSARAMLSKSLNAIKGDVETVVKSSVTTMPSKADIDTAIQNANLSKLSKTDLNAVIQEAKVFTLSKTDIVSAFEHARLSTLTETDVAAVLLASNISTVSRADISAVVEENNQRLLSKVDMQSVLDNGNTSLVSRIGSALEKYIGNFATKADSSMLQDEVKAAVGRINMLSHAVTSASDETLAVGWNVRLVLSNVSRILPRTRNIEKDITLQRNICNAISVSLGKHETSLLALRRHANAHSKQLNGSLCLSMMASAVYTSLTKSLEDLKQQIGDVCESELAWRQHCEIENTTGAEESLGVQLWKKPSLAHHLCGMTMRLSNMTLSTPTPMGLRIDMMGETLTRMHESIGQLVTSSQNIHGKLDVVSKQNEDGFNDLIPSVGRVSGDLIVVRERVRQVVEKSEETKSSVAGIKSSCNSIGTSLHDVEAKVTSTHSHLKDLDVAGFNETFTRDAVEEMCKAMTHTVEQRQGFLASRSGQVNSTSRPASPSKDAGRERRSPSIAKSSQPGSTIGEPASAMDIIMSFVESRGDPAITMEEFTRALKVCVGEDVPTSTLQRLQSELHITHEHLERYQKFPSADLIIKAAKVLGDAVKAHGERLLQDRPALNSPVILDENSDISPVGGVLKSGILPSRQSVTTACDESVGSSMPPRPQVIDENQSTDSQGNVMKGAESRQSHVTPTRTRRTPGPLPTHTKTQLRGNEQSATTLDLESTKRPLSSGNDSSVRKKAKIYGSNPSTGDYSERTSHSDGSDSEQDILASQGDLDTSGTSYSTAFPTPSTQHTSSPSQHRDEGSTYAKGGQKWVEIDIGAPARLGKGMDAKLKNASLSEPLKQMIHGTDKKKKGWREKLSVGNQDIVRLCVLSSIDPDKEWLESVGLEPATGMTGLHTWFEKNWTNQDEPCPQCLHRIDAGGVRIVCMYFIDKERIMACI
ncbi:uncharacterized protein LY89DRAFT_720882 [Mollisia scopiformis]|uniref:Uncharacterized protein n=1 Tax=Mollisia scopiformis TaxID=149040 RepID=A0A194X0A9_MOLSC|nr:uncharacterized protein LY89DRAFT_720882 [Mollisia scopiformis]KUJ13635.1 hypothetical protein LY89DRAFT_720882 [Mollisia scopiformis]